MPIAASTGFTPLLTNSCRKGGTITKRGKKLLREAVKKAKNDKEAEQSASKETKTKLFAYGTLLVHEIQEAIWGESRDGKPGTLYDFEIKLWPKTAIFYAERKPGESIPGKVYELTESQLKLTDTYESESYKRVKVPLKAGDTDTIEVYVRNTDGKK